MPETDDDFRLERAQPEIEHHLDQSHQRVYRTEEIRRLLDLNRTYWHLNRLTTQRDFLKFLCRIRMRRIVLFDDTHLRSIRYVWGDASPYAVALSIRPRTYLTHCAAAHLHGLLKEQPTVYVNYEQSPKKKTESSLTQAR